MAIKKDNIEAIGFAESHRLEDEIKKQLDNIGYKL